MRRIAITLCLAACGMAFAGFTTTINTPWLGNGNGSEVNLDGTQVTILTELNGSAGTAHPEFGLTGAIFTRVNDFGPGVTDQLWWNPDGLAQATAIYAGNFQNFGYLPGASGGAFSPLYAHSGQMGFLAPVPGAVTIPSIVGNLFRFAEQSPNLYTSLMADNGGVDRMVTYQVTMPGLTHPRYLIGFEDATDFDFNDFVAIVDFVHPIPAPAAALLGVIGVGLVGWVKRRLS